MVVIWIASSDRNFTKGKRYKATHDYSTDWYITSNCGTRNFRFMLNSDHIKEAPMPNVVGGHLLTEDSLDK